MRRPLAILCSVIVILVFVGNLMGILPFRENKLLPEDGEYVMFSGVVREIHEEYVIVRDVSVYEVSSEMTPSSLTSSVPIPLGQTSSDLTFLARFDVMPELCIGEGVVIRGEYASFSHAMNPGEFDAYEYYTSKGYDGSVRRSSLIASDGRRSPIREGLRRFRMMLEARIYEVCPDNEASVLCNLLLGDKERIDDETKAMYQNSGIAHILSISGLHISILGMGCFELLRKLKCRLVPAAMISAGILIMYGVMTGMSISASRAVGMFVIRMFSHLFGRTDDSLTSLGIMAALTALTDPAAVTGVSFLLSYGAALGILVFIPAVRKVVFSGRRRYAECYPDTLVRRMRLIFRRALGKTADGLVGSLSIILFTLPVQLVFFFRVPVYAVFLNLLILPCMSLLVFSGMVMLIPGLGIAGSISCILLDLFEALCRLSERLPFNSWNPGRPGTASIVVYYLFVLVIIVLGHADKKYIRIRLIICMALLPAMLTAISFPHPRHSTATQLYVGQGNCNVMITDAGEVYMFDGGSTSRKNVGEYVILPFLRYSGISHIDAIFISHSDEDHMSGCLELIANMDEWDLAIDRVCITPQQLHDGTDNTAGLAALCEEKGIKLECIGAGDEWYSGDTFFTCLHPEPDFVPEDANSGSMCILAYFPSDIPAGSLADNRSGIPAADRLHPSPASSPVVLTGGSDNAHHTILFPGDVQGEGEAALTDAIAKSPIRPSLDVYITSHHGSSGSTSERFLEAAHPRLAINSAGLNNRYGHPHEETLVRLEDAGCAYLNTFETGAIFLDFSGEEIKLRTFSSHP
ncbi:MAG: ComEC/Rec2 family competence protein [Lachnospiraceae bacterium]|nr:ComEC/Rec2 family competence protein [Lachnospiraceae bacterium]